MQKNGFPQTLQGVTVVLDPNVPERQTICKVVVRRGGLVCSPLDEVPPKNRWAVGVVPDDLNPQVLLRASEAFPVMTATAFLWSQGLWMDFREAAFQEFKQVVEWDSDEESEAETESVGSTLDS